MIDYELLEELYENEPKMEKRQKGSHEDQFEVPRHNKTNRGERKQRRMMKEFINEE